MRHYLKQFAQSMWREIAIPFLQAIRTLLLGAAAMATIIAVGLTTSDAIGITQDSFDHAIDIMVNMDDLLQDISNSLTVLVEEAETLLDEVTQE